MATWQLWIIGFGIVGVLCGFQLWQFRRLSAHCKKLEKTHEYLNDKIRKMENQYEFLSKGSIGVGQRLMNTEKRLNQILEKQDDFSAGHASRLLQKQTEKLLKGRVVQETTEGMFTRSEEKLMALVGKNNA